MVTTPSGIDRIQGNATWVAAECRLGPKQYPRLHQLKEENWTLYQVNQ